LSRWAFSIPFLLATAVFAGCIDQGELPAPDDGKQALEWVVPEVPEVDAKAVLANLKTFVKAYPQRQGNVPTHVAAREALAKAFDEAGLEVFRQPYERGIRQENICGLKLGVGEPDVWVVVGAHYDTTTWDSTALGRDAVGARISEGAYDDGSGTQMVVDLARAFAPIDSYYSIAFCAFDGEERGLQGSKAVFDAMQESGKWPHEVTSTRGMLNLDMFGICWPVRAPIYFDVNSNKLNNEVQGIRKDMGIPDDMFKRTGLTLGQSDYAHWYRTDIPTAFFISNFEELAVPVPGQPAPLPTVPGAYPFWHWQDTYETMEIMAGGADMLQRAFATALELSARTLAVMALQPEADISK
jgi:hypothetical protein